MEFFKRRREAKEIERRLRFKKGKSRLESFIRKLKQGEARMTELGKKAHQIGDKEQLALIAGQILWNQQQRNRFERVLLQLETVEARRDQVHATGAFLEAIKAMSSSMLSGASPKEMARMQLDLEKALARAESIEETLGLVMDASADTLFSSDGIPEDQLAAVQKMLAGESEQAESTGFDDRIGKGLRAVENELKRT